MAASEIQEKLIKTFEEIKHAREDTSEYWNARELAPVLDYERWENFSSVVDKAIASCKTSGLAIQDHFRSITKMIPIAKGAERSIDDYELSRYACYLIAQNGHSTKEAIATAQMYFAIQTRKQEVMTQAFTEIQRIEARRKLTETEKNFSQTLWEHDVDGPGIAAIRSKGDEVLFGGHTTSQMKEKFQIGSDKPLADVLPTVSIKAKDLATEITTVNTRQKELKGRPTIEGEHIINNDAVRTLLKKRGIVPEDLPPEEDVKKIAKKYSQLEKMKNISDTVKQAKQIIKGNL